jgi:hypothetical protein
MVGSQEQWDHVVNGRVIRFGTRAFARHLDDVLDESVAAFRRVGSPVAVSTPSCNQVADTGLRPDSKVQNDNKRTAWLSEYVREYGQRRGYAVVDLNKLVCSGGYRESLAGAHLRDDGIHFSRAGAAYVWRWLSGELLRVAQTHYSSSAAS